MAGESVLPADRKRFEELEIKRERLRSASESKPSHNNM
jgi:hypothetical protein